MAELKAGERVKLIKRIQKLTVPLPEDDLPLIYTQFGIEYQRWREDEGIVIDPQLGGIPGDRLLELEEFLASYGKDDGQVLALTEQPKCWEPNRFRLFLSHVSAEKKQVGTIKKALAAYGICSFVAHEDIEPTKKWVDEIMKALQTCHALAALLTPTFHESKWTDQEVGYCMSRKIPVLPVRLGLDPYGFMGALQGLPGSKDPEEVARQVLNVLLSTPETAREMAKALVDQFSNSNSFSESNLNFTYLELIPNSAFTPELLDQIKTATKNNSQIYRTYTLEGKVKTFLYERKALV